MVKLTTQQIAQYAQHAGFSGESLIRACAIALCESSGNTDWTNTLGNSAGVDRGLYQINSYYHAEVSNAQAFDPLLASKAAFRISNSGKDWTPWATFTNGCSDGKMSLVRSALAGSNSSTPVSSGIPNKTGVSPWWNFPRVDNMGYPDPFGGFPKPDSNIQVPTNYPIIALLPGTVSGLSGGEVGWGAVVTIKLDSPLNALADHTAYLHLASATVRVGQHVNAGDLIAYNGLANAAGAQKVPLGFALYHGDKYGADNAWGYMTQANLAGGLLDPVPLLDSAKSGTLSIPLVNNATLSFSTSSSSFATTVLSTSAQASEIVNKIPGFIGICEALDMVEQFVPFSLPTQDNSKAATDIQIFGWDTGIHDPLTPLNQAIQLPSDALQAILVFSVSNFMAFSVRAIFVIIGVVLAWSLLINLVSENIDISQVAGTAIKAAELAA